MFWGEIHTANELMSGNRIGNWLSNHARFLPTTGKRTETSDRKVARGHTGLCPLQYFKSLGSGVFTKKIIKSL